jgi:hypothetical protein
MSLFSTLKLGLLEDFRLQLSSIEILVTVPSPGREAQVQLQYGVLRGAGHVVEWLLFGSCIDY